MLQDINTSSPPIMYAGRVRSAVDVLMRWCADVQAGGGHSNSSSPAVLVGDLDLDKNRLVYTTDRSQFVYVDCAKDK